MMLMFIQLEMLCMNALYALYETLAGKLDGLFPIFFFWQFNGKPMGRDRDESMHSSRMEMLVVDSSATSMCIFTSRPIILAPASTL